MNHIRKNKCKSCGAPKEPAKKRTKRTRRKKSSETGASSVTQSGNVPYEIFHTAGASSAGQASIGPQESLQVAEVGQTQEINPVFDTRNFMMMQQAHGGEIHGSGGGGNPQLTSDTRREGGTSNEPIVYDGGNQDLTTPFRDPRS